MIDKHHRRKTFQLIWKEHIEALNSLKLIGNIELDYRPNEEVLHLNFTHTNMYLNTFRSYRKSSILL